VHAFDQQRSTRIRRPTFAVRAGLRGFVHELQHFFEKSDALGEISCRKPQGFQRLREAHDVRANQGEVTHGHRAREDLGSDATQRQPKDGGDGQRTSDSNPEQASRSCFYMQQRCVVTSLHDGFRTEVLHRLML